MKKYKAKIGCEMGKVAVLTEKLDGDTYSPPTDLAGLQSMTQNVTVATQPIHGDDAQIDEISEFVSGALALTTAGEDEDTLDIFYGTEPDAEGEYSDGDIDAPFVGVSIIAKFKTKNGSTSEIGWQAYFFPKAKFAPGEEAITGKTDALTPTNTTLTGVAFKNTAGKWRYRKKFIGETARADALAWCEAKFTAIAQG